MANAREQIQMVEEELARVRREIERLRVEEGLLVKMQRRMAGGDTAGSRKRSPAVKPIVLDILKGAGAEGASSHEVDAMVRESVPSVAKDTVSSVLSRLKGDGALIYQNERYYLKEAAPTGGQGFRVVS